MKGNIMEYVEKLAERGFLINLDLMQLNLSHGDHKCDLKLVTLVIRFLIVKLVHNNVI